MGIISIVFINVSSIKRADIESAPTSPNIHLRLMGTYRYKIRAVLQKVIIFYLVFFRFINSILSP